MASNRSGSQKFVRVFSILGLVLGILILIVGLVGFFGAGAIVGTSEDVVEVTGEITGTTSQFVRFGSLIMLVSGALAILEGIFGLRASNDATKVMPYLVFAIITLAMNIYSLVRTIMGGGAFTDVSTAISTILPVVINGLNTWCALNIRKEGQQY